MVLRWPWCNGSTRLCESRSMGSLPIGQPSLVIWRRRMRTGFISRGGRIDTFYHHQNISINMKALVLGCSHAAGSEISHNGVDDRDNSYAMHLARMLGYEPANFAISGGSNDAMFRICEQKHHEYDIVIACWTGCNRSEVWDNSTSVWQPIAAGGVCITAEAYRQQWLINCTDDATGRLNKLKNILAMNAMCKVINIDSFWPIGLEWPASVKWPVKETFWDWSVEREYARTAWGHFGLAAHQAYAKYVYENCSGIV